MKRQIKKVDYKGIVYCYETSTGLYFTKRNGKITIQGNTSETQERLEHEKGTYPHFKRIERIISKEILPFRFGWGRIFEFETTKNEMAEIQLETAKIQSGKYSVNEVREMDNLEGFDKEEYNYPQGASQQEQQQNNLLQQGEI